ncbi:hypothetical protein E4U41_005870 [Claviceps citrina]|nr:hypothetical protein E4U41_005870 [Claviceps citrina]
MPLSSQALRGLRLTRLTISCRSKWVPSICRLGNVRWISSDGSAMSSKDKPYYITTPIFYVNAAPHIGHLYTMVLADVFKRWQQIQGRQAFLLTGTDEHGMKIQRSAAKAKIEPKEFCDANSNKFLELAAMGNISYNAFMRTTDPEHKESVSAFWLQLKHALPEHLGLYKGSHEGWYAVNDECFYPRNVVRPSIVPQSGKKIMISEETGSEVEWVEEETWFFPLTKYKDALLRFYDENPDWIQPAHRMNEVRDWVENHLEDLSITRPASRLSWGIQDPEDHNQTIYVWVDALINYITQAGYGRKWHSPSENMGIWPADLQIIGKDILRFHAIYWPALLIALGLPLPKRLLCHNHWTMSDRKMSKSFGNVVSPFFAAQRWDVDVLRYFLMRNGSLTKDMSYSNQLIGTVYAKELQANIGNLFYRVARPKATVNWSTVEAVSAFREGAFQVMPEGYTKGLFASLDEHLEKAPGAFCQEMENYNTAGAIREIFNLLRETNRYVSDTEPWNLVKEAHADSRLLLNLVVYNCAEALRIAGILLQPVMPIKAGLLLNELGVAEERRSIEFAVKGKDAHYGTESKTGTSATRDKKWDTIFPPVPNWRDSDAELRAQLRSALQDKTKNHVNQFAELLAMEARMGEEAVAQMLAETHAAKKEAIQEATASEPLTLQEEYENQRSWRASPDKLTFIVVSQEPPEPTASTTTTTTTAAVPAGVADAEERMRGDVNLFIHHDELADDNDENNNNSTTGLLLRGEIDVMIADRAHWRRGYGRAAVECLLVYVRRNLETILGEYAAGGGREGASMAGLMVKIKEGNAASRALFRGLGFRQSGRVNYFGEVVMAMSWAEVEELVDGWVRRGMVYEEVRYEDGGGGGDGDGDGEDEDE